MSSKVDSFMTIARRAGFSLVCIKLVCLFVGRDSMSLGLVKIEPNLVGIFRGFGMRLFIRHIFKRCFPW